MDDCAWLDEGEAVLEVGAGQLCCVAGEASAVVAAISRHRGIHVLLLPHLLVKFTLGQFIVIGYLRYIHFV